MNGYKNIEIISHFFEAIRNTYLKIYLLFYVDEK